MLRPRNYFRWHRVRKVEPTTLEYQTPRADPDEAARRTELRDGIIMVIVELIVVPLLTISVVLFLFWWNFG